MDFASDVFDRYFGEDMIEFADADKAREWLDQVTTASAAAVLDEDWEFFQYLPNTLRAWAKSKQVVIARGKERLFAERLQLAMELVRILLPKFI